MLIDYIFAFGALGLSGVFFKSKNGLFKGYFLAVLGRLAFATLSGYIFFPTFMPEYFNNALIYSICYNAAYIVPEAILTLVLISIPAVSKALVHIKSLAD